MKRLIQILLISLAFALPVHAEEQMALFRKAPWIMATVTAGRAVEMKIAFQPTAKNPARIELRTDMEKAETGRVKEWKRNGPCGTQEVPCEFAHRIEPTDEDRILYLGIHLEDGMGWHMAGEPDERGDYRFDWPTDPVGLIEVEEGTLGSTDMDYDDIVITMRLIPPPPPPDDEGE